MHDYAIRFIQRGREAAPGQHFKILHIDTKRAKYHGTPWKRLNDREKRRFENLLVINDPENILRFVYE